MNHESRPVLLVDLDGCIAPIASPQAPDEQPGWFTDGANWWNPRLVRHRLEGLAARYDLWWVSTSAREDLMLAESLYGLDTLARVDLADANGSSDTPKLTHVATSDAADRRLAWIDADLGDDAFWWAASRPLPTFLRRTDPEVGLSDRLCRDLFRFAWRTRPRD